MVLDLMEDHLEGQIHRTALDLALVLMESPWEEMAQENNYLVILPTEEDHSLEMDLMEGHLEGQIHMTPLDLALVLMEGH